MANTTGKKYGGRKKGTPNKLTKELRSLLKNIVYNELENIEKSLDELEPKQRIELVINMMPYVFPRIESASHMLDEPLDWANNF